MKQNDFMPTGSAPDSLREISGDLIAFSEPRICCVYFICDGNEVVYVGQSVHLSHRIGNHAHWMLKECSEPVVFYIPTADELLNEVERKWIRRLNPRFNTTHTDRARSSLREMYRYKDDRRAAAMLRELKD